MPFVVLTFASLIAYVGGLVILLRVTPLLFSRAFDDGPFMGIAAADIIGGMLVFGAVAVTFGLFNGNAPVKVLDFFLLVGILIVGARMSLHSFRPRIVSGTFQISRILAGSYSLFLFVAALCYIVLLFVPST